MLLENHLFINGFVWTIALAMFDAQGAWLSLLQTCQHFDIGARNSPRTRQAIHQGRAGGTLKST